MLPRHPWPGKSHHFAYLLPVFGAVAVDRAFGAGGFFLAVGAAVEAARCVLLQRKALDAGCRDGSMVGAAVYAYHRFDGASFAIDATWFRSVHLVTIPGIILFWCVVLLCDEMTGRPS